MSKVKLSVKEEEDVLTCTLSRDEVCIILTYGIHSYFDEEIDEVVTNYNLRSVGGENGIGGNVVEKMEKMNKIMLDKNCEIKSLIINFGKNRSQESAEKIVDILTLGGQDSNGSSYDPSF